jgi:glutaminyl-peptide cyclotransferase
MLRRSVQAGFRRSVQAGRGVTLAAAMVGAMGAIVANCADATPDDKDSIAPTSNGSIAPATDRPIAPISVTAVAPTNGQLGPSGAAFDSARAWKDLEAQVSFGPRPSGTAALQRTRDYILAELKKAGIETRQQIFIAKTPLGEVSMANVIATIPGRRPERLAIASHYDTKRTPFTSPSGAIVTRFVGASDGASSTAALLELARALKTRQNEFTIELLCFDGEEAVVEWSRNNDNTYGSRYYVDAARKSGTLKDLRALVLLDMIGDKDLVIRRDSASTPWLVDIVWAAAARIGHRGVFSNELTAVDDDHMPFITAGIPAVDIIDLDYSAWHTAEDTIDRVSARSLQIVGDVVLAALPDIEAKLR